jgi:Type IV pilin-like G and H, putative
MDKIINNLRRQTISSVSIRMVLGLLGLISIITSAFGQNAVIAQPSATPTNSPQQNRVLQTKLSGQWQAKNPTSGAALIFVFTQDGKLFIQLPSDSKTPTAQELSYRINSTTQPMELDVVLTGTDKFVKTIFELTPTGELRLQLVGTSPGKPRPTAFSAEATLFQKVSDATKLPENVQVMSLQTLVNRELQTEGKQYTGLMIRGQLAYFLEKDKFATTISELGLEIKPETENYRYQISPQRDSSNRVMMTATAKRPELKSYTGAIFVVRNNKEPLTIFGICETEKPSSTPPAMPKAPSNDQTKIQCPAGSNQIERYGEQ